ncbi:MAG TPA: hypothetical protein VLD37_03420 [Candidatus Bilamarchaeum sp.]|nr:hypothetical protein [Candidatus Bilamarchaeum sp.]
MKPLALLVFLALSVSLSFSESDDDKAQRVLKGAAASLGWPETISTDEDDNVGTGKTYTISEHGLGSDEDLHASIAVFSTDQETGFWLGFFDEQFDMDRSSYQGRDAVISRYGKNCNPTGLVKVFNDWIEGWVEEVFGPSEDSGCVTEHGAIVWACGKYLFATNDARSEEGGEEDNMAAALYSSAQQEGLCDYGDTLVIMVDTPDIAGSKSMSDSVKMGQKVNEYYGAVSYGQQPPFKFTFLDADGSRGTDDWYHIRTPMSSFASDNGKFSSMEEEAVKKAFAGSTLSEDLYFERIMLIYPGESQQTDASAAFYDACDWKKDGDYVEVDTSTGKRRIYSKNFIFMSEKRDLGTWAHEFGHSIPSRFTMPSPRDFGRISDRYNYGPAFGGFGQFGEVSNWGLMGYGSWWESNGNSPVHMSGFTKYSARWLDLTPASMNQSYTLPSLEHMGKGGKLLALDDPASARADDYYIIEARDSGTVFGAPETGVVIFKVSLSGDGYHIVNAIQSQSQPRSGTSSGGAQYQKPTLSQENGHTTFTNVPGRFRISLLSSSANSSMVSIESYTPARLVGAAVRPSGPAVAPLPGREQTLSSPPPEYDAPKPDMDLHAYDSLGNHVGVVYGTGEYESTIPGSVSSGDLVDDEEWIFVPEGTDVRFEISAKDTEMFLAENPEFQPAAKPQAYSARAVKFDSAGKRFEAPLGNGTASSGQTLQLPSLSDPSLKYEQKDIPGAGNNSLCPFGALLLFLLAAFSLKR